MVDLFSSDSTGLPLAERMRPQTLDEVVGQEHLTGADGVLRSAVDSGEIPSMILWGPPGAGKTTLARILAKVVGYRAEQFSAVLAGVQDIRRVAREARAARRAHRLRTLLFIDEVHRFNKAQQDALLPHIEDGTIVLIGATTENPSFEVVSALLSRVHVFVINPLGPDAQRELAGRVLADAERGLGGSGMEIEPAALESLIANCDGDGRQLLNALETLVVLVPVDANGRRRVTGETLRKLKGRIFLRSDRTGEEHYNLISALHKSVRGSDPDAALYWLARLLEAGQEPLYVARRLIRMAAEDIGLADPVALMLATAAKEAVHFVGLPEGALALAEVTVYLALAPKSNALEVAYNAARDSVRESGSRPVPLHLRNAPTRLMKDLGYACAYRYPHDYPGHWVDEPYFPDGMGQPRFYRPSDEGREPRLWAQRIDRIRRARELQDRGKQPDSTDSTEKGEDRG